MKTLAAVLALGCLFWGAVAAAEPNAAGHASGFQTLNKGHVLGGPAPLLARPAYPHASGEPDAVPTSGILDNLNLGCPGTILGLSVTCDGGVTDGGGGGLRGLDGISERSSPAPSRSRSSSRPSGQSASPSNDSGGASSGGGGGNDCRG